MTPFPCSLHLPQPRLLSSSHHAMHVACLFYSLSVSSHWNFGQSVFTEWAHNRRFINTQTGTLQRHSRQPGDASHSHQSGSRKEIQLQPFGSTAGLPEQVLEHSRNIKIRSQEVLLPTSSHWPFSSFLETCHVSATTLSASPYGCCYSSLPIDEDTGDLCSKRKVQI